MATARELYLRLSHKMARVSPKSNFKRSIFQVRQLSPTTSSARPRYCSIQCVASDYKAKYQITTVLEQSTGGTRRRKRSLKTKNKGKTSGCLRAETVRAKRTLELAAKFPIGM